MSNIIEMYKSRKMDKVDFELFKLMKDDTKLEKINDDYEDNLNIYISYKTQIVKNRKMIIKNDFTYHKFGDYYSYDKCKKEVKKYMKKNPHLNFKQVQKNLCKNDPFFPPYEIGWFEFYLLKMFFFKCFDKKGKKIYTGETRTYFEKNGGGRRGYVFNIKLK